MENSELNELLSSFERMRRLDNAQGKRIAFEKLHRYFFLHSDTPLLTIDLVLHDCMNDSEMRHLGVRIVQLASERKRQEYRKKLIEVGACGPLLSMAKITILPLRREEMVRLGHQIQNLTVKVAREDAILLFVTARDTAEMTEFDCIRLERQLGYGIKYSSKRR